MPLSVQQVRLLRTRVQAGDMTSATQLTRLFLRRHITHSVLAMDDKPASSKGWAQFLVI
jgi:hypothetical protein